MITETEIQNTLDTVIELGYYSDHSYAPPENINSRCTISDKYMCIALYNAHNCGDIAAKEMLDALESIHEYLGDFATLKTCLVERHGYPLDVSTLAIYKDWANRPKGSK